MESRRVRAPFACVAAVPAAPPLFDWDVLDGVLTATPAPDVLVVRKNELLGERPPTNSRAVRRLFERGVGIVVRRAERHDADLEALAGAFAQELGGRAHVQLFVTPGATHGFGWHYDEEEVCILQTAGTKTYYFRANTRVTEAGQTPDFTQIRAETSPLMTCTLAPRDLLFLPRRMWHVAKADTDSLSISIGVS